MLQRPLRRLAALVLAGAPLAADLHVPGDYANLQTAIDSAAPGEVIQIHGGIHGPITIDRPLTLVGAPTATLVGLPAGLGFVAYQGPVTLSGPGSGSVRLERLEVRCTIDGFWYSLACAGIGGGGFDELHVFDCQVRGPDWTLLTGVADGAAGIETSVPYLLVARSTVEASASDTDACYFFGPDGVPGIDAPGSTVVVLESTVVGGTAGPNYCHPMPGCGGSCPGGYGGTGILCDTLYHAASTILGGLGANWKGSDGVSCCAPGQNDGVPLTVQTLHPLAPVLTGSGPLVLGANYMLDLTPGLFSALLVSVGSVQPVTIPGIGELFLDPLGMVVFFPPFPPPIWLMVPPAPNHVGVELCFQTFDLSSLSSPVIGLLVP